jgi:hypothetical protein
MLRAGSVPFKVEEGLQGAQEVVDCRQILLGQSSLKHPHSSLLSLNNDCGYWRPTPRAST